MRTRHALLVACIAAAIAALIFVSVKIAADRGDGVSDAGRVVAATRVIPQETPQRFYAGHAIVVDKPQKNVTLLFAGDILLARDVERVIMKHGNDPRWPFAAMREAIRNADIAFANLETPLVEGPSVPVNSTDFHSDPRLVSGLVDAGFDVLSLANNHVPNAGEDGVKATIRALDDAGISHAGAGADAREAHRAAVIEREGTRFAFLAYNDRDVVPARYFATDATAGTAKMDPATVAVDIAAAKKEADVVIVSMHSGKEYEDAPDASQTAFARAAVDAGADAVIGHHAHVVQPFEWYKGKPIFYGLGNFVFDQMWSVRTRHGIVATLTFDGSTLASVHATPINISDYARPAEAQAEIAKSILSRLGSSAQPDGTLTLPK